MKTMILILTLAGCEAAKTQPQGDAVEETPRCSILKDADDRNYCNGKCELIKNEGEKNDCLHWRKKRGA
jgi:hypothetical protein